MKTSLITCFVSAATAFSIVSCGPVAEETKKNEDTLKAELSSIIPKISSENDKIARGKYLVTIGGCGDCHSPKKMENGIPMEDPELLLSGHPQNMPVSNYDKATLKNWVLMNMHNTATVGPWGTSFAANITSDSTGIGLWTEDQFFKAMREGKFKGNDDSRPMLPPMPWPNYAKMSDEDLSAVFAYLKSTKPVKNVVPAAMPPGK